jgi:hypothetical protein
MAAQNLALPIHLPSSLHPWDPPPPIKLTFSCLPSPSPPPSSSSSPP